MEILELLNPAQLVLLIYMTYRNHQLELKIQKLEISLDNIKTKIK
jgi:hypothetical protein|tara:strand:- start:773 stop:907 length:135 start_codon:yes stop_codon:yes gene_type:complete